MSFRCVCLFLFLACFTSCSKPRPEPEPNTEVPILRLPQESVDLGGGLPMDLVWIQPGEFTMGTDTGNPDEKPAHKVKITQGFWIGKFEVTQRQWEAIMGSNPSQFVGPNRPVHNVNWHDCQKFLEKLNLRVAGGGFRLPTEAEWEYACTADTHTRYFFGSDEGSLRFFAWYRDNSTYRDQNYGPTAVGRKKPNPFGLYDMHGNIFEWCQDWHGDTYYAQSPTENPMGPEKGELRILRGGSWFAIPLDCRSQYRSRYLPEERNETTGLRVVRIGFPPKLIEPIQ
jgi:formylglycine-generating enzyme required for sulfatase activity